MNDLPPPPHDVGGRFHAPIARDEHDAAHWEKEADAMRMLLADGKRRLFTTDESRFVQEQLDEATYWTTPYYERWIHAFSNLLITKGTLAEVEVLAEEARLRAAGEDRVEAGPGAAHHDHDHHHRHHHHDHDHRISQTMMRR